MFFSEIDATQAVKACTAATDKHKRHAASFYRLGRAWVAYYERAELSQAEAAGAVAQMFGALERASELGFPLADIELSRLNLFDFPGRPANANEAVKRWNLAQANSKSVENRLSLARSSIHILLNEARGVSGPLTVNADVRENHESWIRQAAHLGYARLVFSQFDQFISEGVRNYEIDLETTDYVEQMCLMLLEASADGGLARPASIIAGLNFNAGRRVAQTSQWGTREDAAENYFYYAKWHADRVFEARDWSDEKAREFAQEIRDAVNAIDAKKDSEDRFVNGLVGLFTSGSNGGGGEVSDAYENQRRIQEQIDQSNCDSLSMGSALDPENSGAYDFGSAIAGC